MTVKQISTILDNKPGELLKFTKILERSNIDLRALSLAEHEEFGTVRVIVDKPYNTIRMLKQEGYTCSITEVIAVRIEDKPGSLVNILKVLSRNNINLDYSYAFFGRKQNTVFTIFHVEDPDLAVKALQEAGIEPISQDDLQMLFRNN